MNSATTPDVLEDGTLTIQQAVSFSGLPRTNLYEAMNRRELAWTKVGRRRLIPKRALVDMLRKRLTNPVVC